MSNTIIMHAVNKEQEDALKAIAKALKIEFEVSEKRHYDPEFVAKINESKKQIAEGRFTDLKPQDVSAFIEGL
jgi:hypothetical protein